MGVSIKTQGAWKESTNEFIKVSGTWKPVTTQFIKVGGVWADTNNLSGDKLDYDGVVANDADGTRYLVNKVEPTTHKAPLHSGHSVTLSGDGKVEVPINSILSASVFNNSITGKPSKVTVVDNGGGSFSISYIASNRTPWILLGTTHAAGDNLLLTFKASNIVGTPIFDRYYKDPTTQQPFSTPYSVINGNNSIEVQQADKNYHLYFKADSIGCSFDMSDISLSKIDSVNGSVTVFNGGRKLFENVTLPLLSTCTLKDGTYGLVTKLHTNTFTQADIDSFTARPELMIEWYFGTKAIPSGLVKSADDKCYYNLKELGGTDILAISGTHTTSNTSQYGVQALKVKENANGIPTASSTKIEGKADGRWVYLPLVDNTLQHHLVTKCLNEIKGDITQISDTPCVP